MQVGRTFGPSHPEISPTLIPPGYDPIWSPTPIHRVQNRNWHPVGAAGGPPLISQAVSEARNEVTRDRNAEEVLSVVTPDDQVRGQKHPAPGRKL